MEINGVPGAAPRTDEFIEPSLLLPPSRDGREALWPPQAARAIVTPSRDAAKRSDIFMGMFSASRCLHPLVSVSSLQAVVRKFGAAIVQALTTIYKLIRARPGPHGMSLPPAAGTAKKMGRAAHAPFDRD
jgi:hypothetical protein